MNNGARTGNARRREWNASRAAMTTLAVASAIAATAAGVAASTRAATVAGRAASPIAATAAGGAASRQKFSPYVDARGSIRVPEDYRQWAFLGSWHIGPEMGVDDEAGVAGFHNVYTQRGTLEAFRETGGFPDGAVLVKELLKSEGGALTTGHVSWATDIEGWFVMVKDSQGRFPENPLWGGGWGWALFTSDDPGNTVSSNWRVDCLGCHTPAKDTDWVFVQGYPPLHGAGSR